MPWLVIAVECTDGKNETTHASNDSLSVTAAADDDDDWKRRMRELQGAIILASLVEVTLGVTGVVGVLLRYIGPLTVASVITMIALPLVDVIAGYCQHNWIIAFLYDRILSLSF